jgi:integrase/recombinase XerD
VRIRAVARRRPPNLDPRSFESVLFEYLQALRASGFSESLHKQARLQLPRFFAHLKKRGVRDVTSVTEADVFDFARHLATSHQPKTGKTYSFSSQTSYLMHVKRLFRFLEQTRVILKNPSLDLVLPTWSKLPRSVPTQAQAERLVTVPSPKTVMGRRDRAVLELLYGSGIRVGECERLDLRDLDLARGTVFVRNGKGRKDRVVPIAGRAALAMESYLKHSRHKLVKDPREQAVFLNFYGERLSRKSIQEMLREQVKAAGIPIPFTAHSLRHGCATHMLQRGADVRHVQQLLGHSRIETTALYTRVIPGDVARMIDENHPRQKSYNQRARCSHDRRRGCRLRRRSF